MVNNTESTQVVTKPLSEQIVQPSLKRWLKHLFFLPASKRFFDIQDQHAIAEAVTLAEQGHIGEIQVVIEAYIPASHAYYQNTFLRAKQLFAELGVWDTELNSGILLYINLCEKKVEILVDRGIKTATSDEKWQQICESIVSLMKQKQYRDAVLHGVGEIGEILNKYYDYQQQVNQNELTNAPILLG